MRSADFGREHLVRQSNQQSAIRNPQSNPQPAIRNRQSRCQ
jgi:hypothetical protein